MDHLKNFNEAKRYVYILDDRKNLSSMPPMQKLLTKRSPTKKKAYLRYKHLINTPCLHI